MLLALYELLEEGESLLLACLRWSFMAPIIHLLRICIIDNFIGDWAHSVLMITLMGNGLKSAFSEHVRRAETRVFDRFVDIALLVLAVLIVLDHLQRVVIVLGVHEGCAHAPSCYILAFFDRF